MHRGRCVTVLALVSALVAAGWPEAARQDGEEDFLEGIVKVERLAERGRWDRAREALRDLLEEHRGAAHARARRPEIETLAQRCAFRSENPRPDPEDVVSGKLLRFDERRGRFQATYTMPTDDDLDSGGLGIVHPALFQGELTLEMSGESYPNRGVSVWVLARGDRAVEIDFGSTELDAGSYLPASMHAIAGGDAERLDLKETTFAKPGEPWRIRVKVSRSSIIASFNGRKLLQGKRPPDSSGYVSLPKALDYSKLTLEGEADPAWVQSRIDAADETARREFLKDFDVRKTLPEWLYEEPETKLEHRSTAFRGLPREVGDAEVVAASRMEELLAIRRHAKGLAELEALESARLGEPLRSWYRALFLEALGRREEALAAVGAVLEEHPGYGGGLLMRGRLLLEQRQTEAGREALLDLVSKHPADPAAAGEAAWALLDAGRPSEARGVLIEARKRGLSPKDFEALERVLAKAEKGPSWETTHEVKTAHYLIRSDIDRSVCQEAAEVLEQAYLAYKAWLPKVAAETTERFPVYLFAGERGYHRYAREAFGISGEGSAGLYSSRLKQLLIWNLPDREQMMRTVRHEGFHQYLDRVMPDPPRWFNEGHAEYFETARASDGSWRTGLVRKDHLEVLDPRGLMPLDEFFALADFEFMRDSSRSYAQSWALVHFLHEGGADNLAMVRRLFEGFSAGRPQASVWKESLGRRGAADFEAAFRKHVASLPR